MPNGKGTFTYANGNKFVGEFKDDKYNGQGTFTFADGMKYVGEWKDGKRDGQGTETNANGSKFVGEFKDNKPNGQGTFTLANGARQIGEYKDGYLSGLGIRYDDKGKIIVSGYFEANKLVYSAYVDPARFTNIQSNPTQTAEGRRQRELEEREQERLRTAESQAERRRAEEVLQRQRELEEREARVSERERLRTAELQAERKRREELEEKLRLAQQPPAVTASVGKRVALVIGNAAYKQSPLDTPVNDAKDVAAALRVSGFETQELLNATKTQMLEATRAFERMVLNSDVALIYFAGHGAEVKGKNYMIPVGANIAREYELSEQAYDAAQWLDMLEGVRGTNSKRVNIVILDACRNNELTRSWRSSSNGLAKMDAPVGTFLAYSTAPGKVASDGDRGARNSPFAKHMLTAIKQPNMPIEQVFKRVRSAVIDETKGDQIPWDSSSLVGDFFFTVKK